MRTQKAKIALMALFVLLQFYLLFLKRHETLDVEAAPNTNLSPLLAGGTTVGQTFLSRTNGLARVDVLLATHRRTLAKDILFNLREAAPSSRLVAQSSASGPSVADNRFHPFRFEAVRKSKGKIYLWELSSPAAAPEEAGCVWMNPRDIYRTGEMQVDRTPAKGDCVFRVYYRRPVVTELWRVNRRFSGFLGSPFLIYTAALAFEAALLLLLWNLLGLLFSPATAPIPAPPTPSHISSHVLPSAPTSPSAPSALPDPPSSPPPGLSDSPPEKRGS